MAVVHELIEETEKIGDEQIADVQSVHVGVGGENDFVVAQAFGVVFDVEAAHQVIHLVVFINDVALEIPDVERFAFQDENRLHVHVATTDDGAGGRLTFRDENHRAFAFAFRFVEMRFAIFQLRNANRDRLGAVAREFFYVLQFLAQLLRVLNFRDDFLARLLCCD